MPDYKWICQNGFGVVSTYAASDGLLGAQPVPKEVVIRTTPGWCLIPGAVLGSDADENHLYLAKYVE